MTSVVPSPPLPPKTKLEGPSLCSVDEILSRTPVPTIVVDGSLCIHQVSDSYLALYRRAREQMVGVHLYQSVDRNVAVPMPNVVSLRAAIDSALVTRKVHVLRDILVEDGNYWSIRAIPVFRHETLLYVVLEVENTTEEHMKQAELEERLSTNETFRILVDTVKDYAIFMLNPEGNIATWNAGAQLLKGYTKEDIVGRHFSNFYGLEDRLADKPGKELVIALRDGRVEDEGWRYRKDGSRFWANVIITPVYRGDTLIGFSKVTRDLTERRAAEARLLSAYEESAKLKSEFLANMSHEIRTPMHGMLSALTLLIDTGLDTEQLELAHIIEESGGVLLRVINDILDYSKLASGCFSISSDVISVPDIISSVARSYQATLRPGTRLEVDLDPRLPSSANGDPLRYRQIVQNLVSNATKFTENGHVSVHAMLLEEEENSFSILTEVTDSGIGVPINAVGSLFTPFTQFDNSATKRYQGTGLGLSICKSLAGLMDGSIGFRPNPAGHGSIFWFSAKLKKLKKLEQLDELETKLQSTAVSSTPLPSTNIKLAALGKRLLLAEDNHINQKVMLRMLKSLGFEHVDTALDGVQAVALARKKLTNYDLILMDINMPHLDGVGATVEIRNAGLQIPIIAMTANALKGQAESYLAKGMDDYIAKPVDRQLLLKTLLKWIQCTISS
jgi:osomolarity two-component system sensor histidine kinase TcsA